VEDAEEDTRWRVDAEEERASGCGEMTGLEFGGSDALKKKNSSDGSMLVAIYEFSTPVATMVVPIATVVMSVAIVVLPVATNC
jgi:hypothetical protein